MPVTSKSLPKGKSGKNPKKVVAPLRPKSGVKKVRRDVRPEKGGGYKTR